MSYELALVTVPAAIFREGFNVINGARGEPLVFDQSDACTKG